MHCEFSFGKYKGQTFEWVIFNDPFYAHWMIKKNILSTRYDYDENERCYFMELYERASHLTGTCPICKQRQMTRLAIYDKGGEIKASPYCEECEPGYSFHLTPPSLLIANGYGQPYPASVPHSILEHYVGPKEVFTQADMEEFFRKDSNFVNAEPNFFIEWGWDK